MRPSHAKGAGRTREWFVTREECAEAIKRALQPYHDLLTQQEYRLRQLERAAGTRPSEPGES